MIYENNFFFKLEPSFTTTHCQVDDFFFFENIVH